MTVDVDNLRHRTLKALKTKLPSMDWQKADELLKIAQELGLIRFRGEGSLVPRSEIETAIGELMVPLTVGDEPRACGAVELRSYGGSLVIDHLRVKGFVVEKEWPEIEQSARR